MVEVTKEFPISKEEMARRTRKTLETSQILEVEQRGDSLVMLFGNAGGNFVLRMTFFCSDEKEKARLCFKGDGSGEFGAG